MRARADAVFGKQERLGRTNPDTSLEEDGFEPSVPPEKGPTSSRCSTVPALPFREGPRVRIRLPPGESLLRNWFERWSRGGRARRHSWWISASPASSPSRSAKALLKPFTVQPPFSARRQQAVRDQRLHGFLPRG